MIDRPRGYGGGPYRWGTLLRQRSFAPPGADSSKSKAAFREALAADRQVRYVVPRPATTEIRMASTSLPDQSLRDLIARLKTAQDAFLQHYPGELGQRQPVHTVYGGAQLFKSDTTKKLGELALKSLETYAPDATSFAEAIGIEPAQARIVYQRVAEKLRREAVEDFRIDFEDGYGIRPDAEEDGHAVQAGEECAKVLLAGTLSPFIGIRIKTFSAELGGRSLRTLDLFLMLQLAV